VTNNLFYRLQHHPSPLPNRTPLTHHPQHLPHPHLAPNSLSNNNNPTSHQRNKATSHVIRSNQPHPRLPLSSQPHNPLAQQQPQLQSVAGTNSSNSPDARPTPCIRLLRPWRL